MSKIIFISAFLIFFVVDLANIIGVNLTSFHKNMIFSNVREDRSRIAKIKIRRFVQPQAEESPADVISTVLGANAMPEAKPEIVNCDAQGDTVTLTYSNGTSQSVLCEGGSKGCCLSSEDNGPGCIHNLSCHGVEEPELISSESF